MIRIFDTKLMGASRFDGVGRTIGLNLAIASGAAILALVYFAVGFAAGDSPRPIPPSVVVFLCVVAAGIVGLGIWFGWRLANFPWPAVAFTVALLGAFFALLGEGGAGLQFGVLTSAVLLLGNIIGRVLRGFKVRRLFR